LYTFSLWVGDLKMFTKKQPSAATNPDNHSGSNMEILLAKGLILGVTPGKAACRLSDKPKLMEAFIATILCKPDRVKCSLFKTSP
jgi:hypothetical protein